jgi:protein tyrosine phosphatase
MVAGENQDVTVLVHCSAGVGRTGTFVSLYQLMETLDEKMNEYKKEKLADSLVNYERDKITIDIFNTVFNLRRQRCEMVTFAV